MRRYLIFIFRNYSSRLGRDIALPYTQILTALIGSICYFYFHLISFSFIIQRFNFPSWSIGELYILFFTFEIYTYLAFYLFYRGFLLSVRQINNGQFDIILSKPASSWIITFFQGGNFHNFLAAIFSLIYLFIYLYKYSLHVSILNIFLYIVFMCLSLLFLLFFTSIFISLNFSYGSIQAAGIGFAFQDLLKYPAQIFPRSWLFMLVVIPFSSLVTVPASLLISKPLDWFILLEYFVSFIIVALACMLTWRIGVRCYSSAA